MKTYVHPDIAMPCGTVTVAFSDPAGTGIEITPKLIKKIGDIEEGFDYFLGEFWASDCSIEMWNKNDYVLGTLLVNMNISVAIFIDDELYFLGDIDPNSIDPKVIELSGGTNLGTVRLDFIHRFARLKYDKFSDLLSGVDIVITLGAIYKKMAEHLDLKSVSESDIDWITLREYEHTTTPIYSNQLNEIAIPVNVFSSSGSSIANYYNARYEDYYSLLSEHSREFLFFPSIYYDGTDFIMQIMEKDIGRQITTGNVISTNPSFKFQLDRLKTFLDNIPDGFTPTTGLIYEDTVSNPTVGDDFELNHHVTNNYDPQLNIYLYIPNPPGQTEFVKPIDQITNQKPTPISYSSFHEAIHNAYKKIYFDHNIWRRVIVEGLKGTYSSAVKMKYLSPGYRMTVLGSMHYIHSVKKSLEKNQSEMNCLKVV